MLLRLIDRIVFNDLNTTLTLEVFLHAISDPCTSNMHLSDPGRDSNIPAGADQDVLGSVCCSFLRTLKAGSGTGLLSA